MAGDSEQGNTVIDNDDVFDALADGQRRQLLISLLNDGPQRVPELSDSSRQLAEAHESLLQEHLSSVRELDETNEQRLRMHLVHLPRLVGYDFVEWDRDARLVTKGPRFDEIRPVLELLEARRDERSPATSVPLLRR